ncbi:MAG: hypothetical protein GY799_32605 [Desulfobulbaceae bacterium]|nr:hypothetical protein [Desulfobulbaceae bacterium]
MAIEVDSSEELLKAFPDLEVMSEQEAKEALRHQRDENKELLEENRTYKATFDQFEEELQEGQKAIQRVKEIELEEAEKVLAKVNECISYLAQFAASESDKLFLHECLKRTLTLPNGSWV